MAVEASTQAAAPKAKAVDYRSNLKPIWCPGCGDFGVLNALHQALAKLGVPAHDVAVVSGIGCSSRIPGYCATYGFNSIHGRALPIAAGVKLASPETTVIAAGGDGDGLSIGAGHFPHAGRRNVDITYIMMDNSIYGLTKGQASPTTPSGDVTKSTPYGSNDMPLDAVELALAYNVSFVGRGFSGDVRNLATLIAQAIEHPGFSFVHVLSPCVTFRGITQFKEFKANVVYLEEDAHDTTSLTAAYQALMRDDGKIPLGIFHKHVRPTLNDLAKSTMATSRAKGEPRIDAIMDQFMP